MKGKGAYRNDTQVPEFNSKNEFIKDMNHIYKTTEFISKWTLTKHNDMILRKRILQNKLRNSWELLLTTICNSIR